MFDLLSSRSQTGRYVSSEELEKLNPAGSMLVRASTDKGDTDRDRTFTATDSAQTLTAVCGTSPSDADPAPPDNEISQQEVIAQYMSSEQMNNCSVSLLEASGKNNRMQKSVLGGIGRSRYSS